MWDDCDRPCINDKSMRNYKLDFNRNDLDDLRYHKAHAKRTQHCRPTTRDTVGPNIMRPFAWNRNNVGTCWHLLRRGLKPVKRLDQYKRTRNIVGQQQATVLWLVASVCLGLYMYSRISMATRETIYHNNHNYTIYTYQWLQKGWRICYKRAEGYTLHSGRRFLEALVLATLTLSEN